MIDLHAAIEAALDREQAESYACDCEGFAHDHARILRRVEADRETHAEHTAERCGVAVNYGVWVSECIGQHPCKVTRSLAARYDVEMSR